MKLKLFWKILFCPAATSEIWPQSVAPHWAAELSIKPSLQTALLHYQSTALNTDITGPPANTPATNTANTAASFMRKNPSPSSNSNSVVMSEEITDSAVGKTLEDKILKLKELIEDCSNSSKQNKSDNQYDKCEKLQHKLRYLEYYQSYDLGACPE